MLKKPTRHERLLDMAWMVGGAATPQGRVDNMGRDVVTMLQTEWQKACAGHDAEEVLNNPETRQAIVADFLEKIEDRLNQTFVKGPNL